MLSAQVVVKQDGGRGLTVTVSVREGMYRQTTDDHTPESAGRLLHIASDGAVAAISRLESGDYGKPTAKAKPSTR